MYTNHRREPTINIIICNCDLETRPICLFSEFCDLTELLRARYCKIPVHESFRNLFLQGTEPLEYRNGFKAQSHSFSGIRHLK